MITSEDQLKAVKLYGPDTENKTITVNKNITLYAVWLQDDNGNGTPDYEETSGGTGNTHLGGCTEPGRYPSGECQS